MDEIKRILDLNKDKRLPADIEYLEKHASELTDEQQIQLEDENKVANPINPLIKNIGKKVVAKFDTVVEELENGMLRAIVNSGQEDRHGEILNVKGLDTKEYMKNPVLANGHDYSKPSVGRTYKLTKKDNGSLVADFKFATDIDGYDEPKILDQLYRKKYQFAFSISFIPQEVDKNTYTKSTMIEFSPILIPADGNALLLAKKLGIDKEILKPYNKSYMNPTELLAKLLKDGKDAMTADEIKTLQEYDNFSDDEVKSLTEALKDVKPATDKSAEIEKSLAALKEIVDAQAKEIDELKTKTVEKKEINGQHDMKIDPTAKKEVSKEMKFLLYTRGLMAHNFADYINAVGKDAMSTSGNVVVPPAEFIAEITRLEESVGVAERFATVRRMNSGAGLKYVMGDDDLEIFDTAEGVAKKSTKLTYKELTLTWRKWAGILPITDELSEDSAIDLWNDATSRFARAFSKKGDELVFTNQAAGGVTKDGIMYVTGTHGVEAAGDAFSDITWENLSDMIYGVPTASADGGRFWLNREALGVISKMKDQQDRPIWLPSIANGVPATILGKPYTEVAVLPTVAEEEAGLPVIAFGDLKYATFGMRTDLAIKIFDAGVVGDPDEEDQDANTINLVTQDVQAMRAVKRMNAVIRFPEAFSVLTLKSAS